MHRCARHNGRSTERRASVDGKTRSTSGTVDNTPSALPLTSCVPTQRSNLIIILSRKRP